MTDPHGWQPIETAPKDEAAIKVKRVYEGRIVYEGLATWRTVHFGALNDPISGVRFAEERDATGWMYPDQDKRVPTPTHWRPETSCYEVEK